MAADSNIERIRDKVDRIKVCMLVTLSDAGRMRARPMHVAKMEDDATFWFFTDEYSGRTATLETDNPVTLTFADPVNQTYLSITGRAYLVNDEVKMTEMWNPVLKNWFPGGTTVTEHLTMIKIVPETAEFWEESRSAWQQVFYAGKAMFTGEKYTRGSHERVTFQES